MWPQVDALKICAAVVTYNRLLEVRKTIRSINIDGLSLDNIIVIDNNSSEKGYDQLSVEFVGLHYIRLNNNLSSAGGFALAMNYAVEKGYDWIWLFNDDSRPVFGALLSLKEILYASQLYSIIQIGTLDKFGFARKLNWKGVRVPIKIPRGNSIIESDLVTFDGCLINTKVISSIGTCDPEFFMGTYEFDFCLRAHDAGFKIGVLPNGLLDDQKLGSNVGVPPWREYYNTRNHLLLAISRRSFQTFRAWIWREFKFIIIIILKKDKKLERIRIKWRALIDALKGKRGKVYEPS